jgi:hypothetical protein
MVLTVYQQARILDRWKDLFPSSYKRFKADCLGNTRWMIDALMSKKTKERSILIDRDAGSKS